MRFLLGCLYLNHIRMVIRMDNIIGRQAERVDVHDTNVGNIMIADGIVRGVKDFFKDYKGCRNCKHQPEPLTMCDYGKRKTYVELICTGWERKDGEQNA